MSAKTQQENKKKSIKQQKGSLDTYTLFLEQAYNIGCKNCSVSMIVPLSITSSESASGVHNLLFDNCHNFHISSYAVRPQPVFKNAVVDVSIITFVKGINKEEYNSIYATKLQRKGKNFNLQCLIDHLQFVDVQSNLLFGRIPKIGTETEKSILDKLKNNGKPLSEYIDTNNGKPIYYRAAGGRYFKVVTNYTTNSSAEKYIKFSSEFADSIGCILSSNLSFWFYQVYSDNHNWKSYEIKNFPMPILAEEEIQELTKLYQEYLSDIEMHANVRQTSQGSSYHVTTFKEYKIGKSKGIIDKIDNLIGPLYGLTKEEISFVQNYEIEFRLQSETQDEE